MASNIQPSNVRPDLLKAHARMMTDYFFEQDLQQRWWLNFCL